MCLEGARWWYEVVSKLLPCCWCLWCGARRSEAGWTGGRWAFGHLGPADGRVRDHQIAPPSTLCEGRDPIGVRIDCVLHVPWTLDPGRPCPSVARVVGQGEGVGPHVRCSAAYGMFVVNFFGGTYCITFSSRGDIKHWSSVGRGYVANIAAGDVGDQAAS